MTPVLLTVARLGVVSTLVAGMSCLGAVGHADGVRTETTLGGFAVSVEAAPLKVLLDDPQAAIPRPTGTAIVEGDPNYTLASVATGPNSRGLASTVWPGNLFGEGLAQFGPNVPNYPLKAEAKYPDRPYTEDGKDGGQLSRATASGLDAFATATGVPSNLPGGQLDLGTVASTSTATVTDKGVALGTTRSQTSDVDLLGGVIHVGSVTTTLTVSSDGKKPTSAGSTAVTGLTVMGQGFTVDDRGVHAAGQDSGLPSLSPLDALKALGISISGVTQVATKDAETATASRTASGLVISIDTTVFKAATAPVVGPLRGPYSGLVSQIVPPEYQGNFYYLLNATPSITFVLGSASGSSGAVLPISFDFPPLGFPPGPGAVAPPLTSPGQPVVSGVSPGAPTVGLPVTGPAPAVPQPVFQPPGVLPAAAATDTSFGGISPGLLLLALGLVGAAGFGLLRLLGLAVGLPLGLGCRLGAPTSLPDLRSVPA